MNEQIRGWDFQNRGTRKDDVVRNTEQARPGHEACGPLHPAEAVLPLSEWWVWTLSQPP
jgi:hypothetical protein